MAKYLEILRYKNLSGFRVDPSSWKERLKLCYYNWRYPDKVAFFLVADPESLPSYESSVRSPDMKKETVNSSKNAKILEFKRKKN